MAKITFITVDGVPHIYDVAEGESVMRGGVDNDVKGMKAECGGACACATCQVLIAPEWADKIPPMGPNEASMIDEDAGERGMARRLSCQITVSPDLDGLVVYMPASQY